MNKIFNKRLYLNTIGRLKLSGSIFLILCIVLAYVPIIDNFANPEFVPHEVTAYLLAYPLYFFMYIGSIVLTMSAFSYLNSRAASDFYHSLPNTRLSTLFSVLGGVLTWIVGTIVATCVLSTLGYMVLGCSMDMGALLTAVGYPLMVSLEVVGCAIIGMSVTGTFFSGIITTGLVAFLPRVLIIFFQMVILSTANILPSYNFTGGFFDNTNNLATAFLSPILNNAYFGYGATNLSFTENPMSYLYTAVLVLIYFAAGAFLFVRRKSETAGKAAPGKITQAIYRCAITLPILLIFYSVALYSLTRGGSQSFVLTLIMIGAAIVYFVYEAIVSRKLKSLLRALPLFVILVAATGVLAFAARNVGLGIMKYVPAEEDVASIQLLQDNYERNYNSYLESRVKLTDQAVITSSVASLGKTVQYEESRNGDYHYGSMGEYVTEVLRYNMKDGTSIARIVNILKPEAAKIAASLEKNEEYLAASNKVPDKKDISEYHINDSQGIIDNAAAEDIFNAFLTDLENSGGSSAAPLTYQGGSNGPCIYVNVKLDGTTYYQSYSITSDTPLALKKYMDYADKESNLKTEIGRIQKSLGEKADMSISVTAVTSGERNSIFAFSDTKAESPDYNGFNDAYLTPERSDETADAAADLIDIIKNAMGREVAKGYRPATVGLYVYGGDDETNVEPVNCSGVVLLTDDELKQINNLCNIIKEKG